MKTNGERFEEAYNKIDALLRKKAGLHKSIPYSRAVAAAASCDATVRLYQVDLLEYGDLRNAIVHERGQAPFPIADPREDVVQQIDEIWNKLSRPRKLRSIPCRFPIRIFSVAAALPELLSYMRQNDFSQVVASRDVQFVIVSTEGIAHWLEHKSDEDIISLGEARLGEVLEFEPKDTCIYLSADRTVDEAREVFTKDLGKRVFSALVTENGRPTEKPINIITPWDFVRGALSYD